MKRDYKLSHKLMAFILLVSLFLQSCGSFQNQIVPQEKGQPSRTIELADNSLINIDKKFVTSGGYLASFYENEGELKADLKADGIQPEPNYKAVPVVIEKGTDLAFLTELDPKTQQSRVQFQPSQNGQPGHVIVLKGGIPGGMMEEDGGSKSQEGVKEFEEKKVLPHSVKIRKGFKNEKWFREALFIDLPGYELGTAYDDGDCFFDALAQWLNKINNTGVNTIKYLRMLCHEFYLKNETIVNSWNQEDYGGIDKGRNDYYRIQYTSEECDQLFHGRSPIWGRQHIEGRILCKELQLKGIAFIEVLKDPDLGSPVISYHLVENQTYKSSISEEEGLALVRTGDIPVLVNVEGKLHFVPLWKKEKNLREVDKFGKRKGEQPNKNVKEKRKKKEEFKNDTSNYGQLLELAIQGNAEAQYQLGKRAYEAWKEQKKDEDYQEVNVWLDKAASQGHEAATFLLQEINLILGSEAFLKQEEKETDKVDTSKDFDDYQDLLELAIKGDAGAQYQLGKRAYEVWQYGGTKEAAQKAKAWLGKAEGQRHTTAIVLLKKLRREMAFERLHFNKSLTVISQQEISCVKELGDGNFGTVFQATYKGKPVAVKKLKNRSKEQIDDFEAEAIIMANHRHKNLTTFIGFCPEEHALVMEYMPCGSLWDLLKSSEQISWQERCQIALDVAEGMTYLHGQDVVHRDLKSRNILLDRNRRAKVTDFGISVLKSESSTFGKCWEEGTLPWMAPEIFLTNTNNPAGDVYSYGMVLWQLGARKEPFETIKGPFQIYEHVKAGNREKITDDTPPELKKVIGLCWLPEPPLKKEINTWQRPVMSEVRHLVEKGYRIFLRKENKQEKGRKNALKLLFLVREGKLKKVQRLVANVTDINAADAYGWTALHHAVASTIDEDTIISIMKLLLDNGADINAVDKENRLPLDYAEEYGRDEIAAFLTEEGNKIARSEKKVERKESINKFKEGNIAVSKKETPTKIERQGNLILSKVDKGAETYVERLINGAKQGNVYALYHLSAAALGRSEFARKWAILKAAEGDKEAQYILGQMYEKGKCVEQNEEKAVKWYIKAANQGLQPAHQVLINLALKGDKPILKKITQKAEQGDKGAQYILGQMYEQEKGVEYDEGKAVEWYAKAANQGHLDAVRALRELALRGNKLAQGWAISKAAEGDKEAQYILGQMYEQEEGVEQDEEKAAKWYMKAANQGHLDAVGTLRESALRGNKLAQGWAISKAAEGDKEAQYILGQMYEQGQGVEQDTEKAVEWYIRAAKHKHEQASKVLKELALKSNKLAQGWIVGEAEQEDNELQYILGQMYEKGQGVEQNEEKAAEWYTKAANQGHLDAVGTLRELALKGNKLAQGWIVEEAKQGDKEAQYIFGQIYEKGQGVEQNEDKAAEWYIRANKQGQCETPKALRELALKGNKLAQRWAIDDAKHGHKEAQYTLGQMYNQGQGVEQDEDKAAEWYIKAAKQEQWHAPKAVSRLVLKGNKLIVDKIIEKIEERDKELQYILGQIYEKGQGVEQDEEKAAEWYTKAANQGHLDAVRALRELALKGNKFAHGWMVGRAEQGDKELRYTLGQMYEKGKGVEQDENKAAEWYIKAANQEHGQAPKLLRELALKENKFAHGWMVGGAEQGDNELRYTLGQMYEQGQGVEQDENKAAEWYIRAAKHKHEQAPKLLRELALKGNKLAQRWAIDEAEEGKKEAQYTLGQMYEQGIGVEQDENKAVEWYIRAAKHKHEQAPKLLRELALKGNKLAQRWAIDEAEEGKKEAQYTLGQMYKQGIGVEQDIEKAVESYIRAAKHKHEQAPKVLRKLALRGNKFAQNWVIKQAEKKGYWKDSKAPNTIYQIGQIYEQGIGVEQDEEKAVEWYIRAANHGEGKALKALGELALRGIIFAQGWIVEQAKKGNEQAQYIFGQMYRQGAGVKQNEENAVEWYIKAANQYNLDALETLRKLALGGNKLAQNWAVEQSKTVDEEAQYFFGHILGQMYEQGVGVKQDRDKAIKCYTEAARYGNRESCSSLIKLALRRNRLAQKWVIEQAGTGDSEAQYTLGQMYKQGIGIEQDEEKAAEYYIRAANQGLSAAVRALRELALRGNKLAQGWAISKAAEGDKEAQYILGQMYVEGLGVDKDYQKALKWFRESAWQGNIFAQYNLGIMYYKGDGANQDYQKALRWFEKAAEQGDITAQAKVDELNKLLGK